MLTHRWLTDSSRRKLLADRLRQARSEGWARWIRTEADANALLKGCYFDADAVEAVINFCSLCPQVDGEWQGQPLELLYWQVDGIIGPLFGWRRPDGTRRFRTAYISVARKNGKSTLMAALALYMLAGDNEDGAQVILAAVDREQANAVYKPAAAMVEQSPDLSEFLEVQRSTGRIYQRSNYSELWKLSRDARQKQGLNPHLIVYDELHVVADRNMWDALSSGKGARRQPLLLLTTTAGANQNSVCYEQYQRARRIIDGLEHDDIAYHACIYEAAPEDDPGDEETWKKANPSLGVTKSVDYLVDEFNGAKTSPSEMTKFQRFELNRWVAVADAWIDPAKWAACEGELPDLSSLPCWMGLDLANTQDFNALILLWREELNGNQKFYVRPYFWLPEERVAERSRQNRLPYREWVQAGYIIESPGATTDYELIGAKIKELAEQVWLQGVCFDRFLAPPLVNALDAYGLPCVAIPQTMQGQSAATKEMERLVLDKRIVHNGNPLLSWMISNAVIYRDADENIRPDRKRSGDKIDGVVALVNALARATVEVVRDVDDIGITFV